MLRKWFGGIRMTWARLIPFAVISGLVTGLIALLVPDGWSVRQIAVTFEAWIVLAILVVVNCDTPAQAAGKTFVYFLISQSLIYLVQVPFSPLGFGLFRYYYPYWALWTLATLPGGFIAWFIRRDDALAAAVLSVALSGLLCLGTGYLRELLRTPPRFLLAALFCFGSVPLLILCVLRRRGPRLIAAALAAAALAACLFVTFRGGESLRAVSVSFSVDESLYPVTAEWSVRLADPDNGTVALAPGDGAVMNRITVRIEDPERSADIILVSPEGEEHRLEGEVVRDGHGAPTLVY